MRTRIWLMLRIIRLRVWILKTFFSREIGELTSALDRAYGDATWFLNYGDFKRDIEWDASYIEELLNKYQPKRKDLES